MARHGGLGTAAILYSFGQLGSSLSQYAGRQREQKRKKRMAILGAEFSKRIAEVTDVDELTGLMLKANEIASVMEIPELAQQINNLGRLKQLQLVNAKKQLEAGQLSQFTSGLSKDIIVEEDGKFIKFGESKQSEYIKTLPIERQSEALVQAVNQMQITKKNIVTEGATGYTLRTYGFGKGGRSELLNEFVQTESGRYDDLLTTDIVEQGDEPIEIAQQKFKDLQLDKASDRTGGTKAIKTTVFQTAEGSPFFVNWYVKPDGSMLVTDMEGNKLTQEQLNNLSKNKQSKSKNPYESADSYQKWYADLDFVNSNNSSELVKTVLQTTKDPQGDFPDLYYQGEFGLQLKDPSISSKLFWRSGDLDRLINDLNDSDNEIEKGLAKELIRVKTNWYNSNADFEAIQNRTYQPNKKKKSTTVIKPEDKPGDTDLVSPFAKDSSGGFSIYSN